MPHSQPLIGTAFENARRLAENSSRRLRNLQAFMHKATDYLCDPGLALNAFRRPTGFPINFCHVSFDGIQKRGNVCSSVHALSHWGLGFLPRRNISLLLSQREVDVLE